VINSIDLETGKKYQSNKKQRELVKEKNDEVCRKHGLSIPEHNATMRYTQAEKGLIEKGKISWKDEIREKIEEVKLRTSDLESFSEYLTNLGVEVKVRGENISYKPSEGRKWVRGKTLGEDYTKGALENEFAVKHEQQSAERTIGTATKDANRDIGNHRRAQVRTQVVSREDDFELE